LAQITQNDVETISVLKEVAHLQFMALMVLTGVIIVTTKKGNKGKPVVNYKAIQQKPGNCLFTLDLQNKFGSMGN